MSGGPEFWSREMAVELENVVCQYGFLDNENF
jgi:hypothetical protein